MQGVSAGGHEKQYRGATNEWYTPKWILDALGPFDDDPCLPGRTDGLIREWGGLMWVNPPYGPECGKWLHRLAEHGNGIALVFARTETRWFCDEIWSKADSLFFLKGRIKFLKNGVEAKGNAGAPSVLVGYGELATDRLRNSGLQGTFVEGWR